MSNGTDPEAAAGSDEREAAAPKGSPTVESANSVGGSNRGPYTGVGHYQTHQHHHHQIMSTSVEEVDEQQVLVEAGGSGGGTQTVKTNHLSAQTYKNLHEFSATVTGSPEFSLIKPSRLRNGNNTTPNESGHSEP
ncbi:hypothetical protein ZHAS_00004927 [Anopheles sinensis]|uniref:Uncharacterized protein n=1 Tax=Anopheles sinensis TaxID=74873 RepID=A0A084VI85_ANOSI|nr:hypothetical protein ZHAS_00004927 [Anopheles sinensis]